MQINNLKGHVPDSVIEQIPSVVEITNPLRLAHFLAQCSHESGGFKRTVENLNYSAEGLLKIFPRYFTKAQGIEYARNQVKIANRVYANRMGNGDEASGDGWKHRGVGYLQSTGKDNHKEFSDFISVDCVANPNLIATEYPLASAGFFFTKNNIWEICDRGSSDTVITAVSKKVNGGENGLSDRISLFKKFYLLVA
jgi:putative chitinase